MKKIINKADTFVDEVLNGIVLSHPDKLRFVGGDEKGIVRKEAPIKGKVAIATGGGAGHLPLFLGYVGKGLADGVSIGHVFTSPSADTMYHVSKEINGGEGILFLYGNYFGDMMNFDVAAEMLEEDNIRVETVRISDDVASAPREEWKKRRGVAGIFFAYKIAGASAERKWPLDQVKRVTEKTAENVATMGVAISPCIIPESGKPTFSIEDDEMEMGMGIHGEPGVKRTKLKPAKEIATEILDNLLLDLNISERDEVSVLVNGAGATPLEELYIVANEVHKQLKEKNIDIYRTFVGEYATSLEMGGCSISLLKMDEEIHSLLDEEAHSPFIKEGAE